MLCRKYTAGMSDHLLLPVSDATVTVDGCPFAFVYVMFTFSFEEAAPEFRTKSRRSGVDVVTQTDGLVTELPPGSETEYRSEVEWT